MKSQKRIASRLKNCSVKRIKFNPKALKEIAESITKADIRKLIKKEEITVKSKKGTSRSRAKKKAIQRKKGRQKGPGSFKGKKTARNKPKRMWINRIRLQREHLSNLKKNKELTPEQYRDLYRKTKGGFFRSRRHLKLYISERMKK